MRYLAKILNITAIVIGCLITIFFIVGGICEYLNFKMQAQQAVTERQITEFIKAIEIYKVRCSTYPSNLKEIQGDQLGYLKEIPQDPWGSEYIYELSKENGKEYYKIISYGADKKPGGEGENTDISKSNKPREFSNKKP